VIAPNRFDSIVLSSPPLGVKTLGLASARFFGQRAAVPSRPPSSFDLKK